ncbi:pectinesterase 1-like [Solanum dulcamara]|uniref:pectinesterase 1-like n=1 Tax=Solanum dulcamara TaxID=45834 RepID=UPI0024859908|nr:pectinesterase 1-like [Solanum dulcamara]
MDESISNKERLVQDEKSSSRTKRKLRMIICLLALFTLIIVAIISVSIILKHETESKSLSFYPTNAITLVCDLISEYPDSCYDSIAALHYAQIPSRDKINPSRIFILSLYASRIELDNVASSIEKAISEVHMIDTKTVGVLRNCQGMIEFALKQLNESETSLGIDPDEKILAINKVVWDLQRWIGEAMGQVQRCYDLLEKIPSTVRAEIREKSYEAQQNMKNSRGILQNMDDIFDLFYPRIGTALGSLVWEFDYGLTVWLFCFEYLLLIFLFCLLLRV